MSSKLAIPIKNQVSNDQYNMIQGPEEWKLLMEINEIQ